jgi:hypothetical protein
VAVRIADSAATLEPDGSFADSSKWPDPRLTSLKRPTLAAAGCTIWTSVLDWRLTGVARLDSEMNSSSRRVTGRCGRSSPDNRSATGWFPWQVLLAPWQWRSRCPTAQWLMLCKTAALPCTLSTPSSLTVCATASASPAPRMTDATHGSRRLGCAPIRSCFGRCGSAIPWSWSCARGRGWRRSCSRSAFDLAIVFVSNCGVTIRSCSNLPTTSPPSGSWSCG